MTIRQELREEDLREGGAHDFRRIWNDAKARGHVENLEVVRHGIENRMGKVADALELWIKEAGEKPGRKHALLPHIQDVDPAVMAYITTRYCFNALILKMSLTGLERDIGTAIEDEIRIAKFEAAAPGSVWWVEDQIKKRGLKKRSQKRALYYTVARHKGVLPEKLPEKVRVQIGQLLVHLFVKSSGLCYIQQVPIRGGKIRNELRAHADFEDFLFHRGEANQIVKSIKAPMFCPPKSWEGIRGGGFLTEPPLELVKNMDAPARTGHVEHLENADLSKVYRALEALDNTPFRINTRVWEVLNWAWEFDQQVCGLPAREPLPIPAYPEGAKKGDEAHKSWKKQARNVHEANDRSVSKRLDVAKCINDARDLVEEPELFFPNQLDFRGRIYQVPISLQNQGPDYARALLEFAEGKYIEDDDALGWLMIHGANLWGEDKCTFPERIKWVEDNLDKIKAVDTDPLANTWWQEADKPWQFLGWCFDFVGVLCRDEPSHVRVSMDGSCNGLQHFSAMLRDPVGAKAVNLADNKVPEDVYLQVADLVCFKLHKFKNGKEKQWARKFHQIGIDRKVTKRAVMVMPYGGTLSSTVTYVEAAVQDKLGDTNPFGDEWNKAIYWLGKIVFDATREVIDGGAKVMDWLQKVAGVAAKAKVHLKWTLPHGFVARQKYVKFNHERVETRMDGRTSRKKSSSIYHPTDKIDSARSRNSISPNFVHSLDACALMMTINKCLDVGVTNFHMVHDDYGTHAADTQSMYYLLREAFVELYRDHDVLGDFHKEALSQIPVKYHKDIPEPPKQGDFDIEEVMHAAFFFA